MATTPSNGNGQAPTKEAAKLVRADYDDRALAALNQERLMDNQLLLRTLGEYDPDNITFQDRRRMRQDPMIKMGLWYAKAPMINAEWSMECTDRAIAAAMTEVIKRIYVPVMKTALTMFDFGFQPTIKQFELGRIEATFEDTDGQVKPAWDDTDILPVILGDLIPIPPNQGRVRLKDGRFKGIETQLANVGPVKAANDEDENYIPAEWCVWFANEFEEEFRNYYGRARIDPAYRAWWSYWFNYHMRDRHAESDADPALQVWYPPGKSKDAEGNTVENRDAALAMGHQLRSGATIAWPSDVHVDETGRLTTTRLWEAGFLTGGENLAAFTDLLADLEIQKLRSTLVPEQALVEARRGTSSRNAAASYIDIFNISLEQTMAYVDHLVNKYVIRPIVVANWGEEAPRCEKVTTGFKDEDLTLAGELIKVAFQLDPNALPIDFNQVIDRLGLPKLSNEEQEQRDQEVADQQAAQAEEQRAAAEAAAAQNGPPNGPPGQQQQGPDAQQLSAQQPRGKARKYEVERINLDVKPTRDSLALAEHARQRRNVAAVSERLGSVAETYYTEAFAAAANALAERGQDLGVADVLNALIGKIQTAVERVSDRFRPRFQGEMASMYHTAGAAELLRLGLDSDSWDVGRDEVQEWARDHAAELVKTIDSTIIHNHVKPWLELRLGQMPWSGDNPQGIPAGTDQLAAELTQHFSAYPQWMAERLVRSEARMGYNASALDMWERVGVEEVDAIDGLGGKTGKTDAKCLARNGQRFDLSQARVEDRDEHPNGTLCWTPVTADIDLRPLQPGRVNQEAAQSLSVYAVTKDGVILSERETGLLLADG